MVGGSFLVVGESQALTPQTGSVNVQITYGATAVASSSTTFTIKDFSGTTVASGMGPHNAITLNYGKYYIEVNPLFTSSSIGQVIADKTTVAFTLGSSSLSLPVSVSTTATSPGYLNVSGITSGSASVSLVTTSGFAFENFTMTSTSNNVSAYLPNAQFYVNVNYNGNTYTQAEPAVSSSGKTVSVTIGSSNTISGFVTSQSGAILNQVTAVVLNPSSNSYTVSHFTGGTYSLQSNSFSGDYIFVSSPGYNATQIYQPSGNVLKNVVLTKASSSVYYNYSLSSSLQSLTLKITYDVGNNTTIPNYFKNSEVGSFYWQNVLDNINSQGSTFLTNLAQKYTDKSIMVAGEIFNMTGSPTVSFPTQSPDSFTGSVTATYANTGISSSLGTTGYKVQIYALGTQSTPGSFNYYYNFTYNNPTLSLSSVSGATVSSYKSPILVNPISSSQWVTLNLAPAQPPAVIDSYLNLYWTGMPSNNYLLDSSASNTAFIVQQGAAVSFNTSNAYFNRAGSSTYEQANFTWKVVGGNTYYGYNTSISFTQPSTKITLNATSAEGAYNVTTFTVITSTANPSANYSVTLAGNTLSSGSGAASPISISVPQSSLVTYSAYTSSLNVEGYSVPLSYQWFMPNYTSTAQNTTYSFSQPYISVGTQNAYLNVSTVFGTYKNVTFNVNVNDTTPPVPAMKLTNSTGASVSQPTAGSPTVFSANTTTDPYYAETTLTYKWAVMYPNGTAVQNGTTTYDVVGGAMNGSYIILKFNTLSTMVVSLKATNPSGASAYNNKTVNMIVNTPRIAVNSIYMKGNLTQGSQTTIYVNVSNEGTVTANEFSLAILINGNQVASHTYTQNLTVGQYSNVSFNYTPATSGKITLVFQANNASEPAFMAPLGSYKTTLNINAPAYKTPLIIGSIIAVIVVVGVVYYRLSSGKTTRKPKQQPKPKTELKKPTEKKK